MIGPRFLADNCLVAMLAAFGLVMAGALLVLSVFTPIFSSMVMESALGPIDRALGFLFGAARGILLLSVAFMIYAGTAGAPDAQGNVEVTGGMLGGRDLAGVIEFQPLRDAAGTPVVEKVAGDLTAALPDMSQLSIEAQDTGIAGWFADRLDKLQAPCSATGTDAAQGT